MSQLAFFASPIDFEKNDKLKNKLNEVKRQKINADMLSKLGTIESNNKTTEGDVKNIHNNLHETMLKEENDQVLADFYKKEVEKDLKEKVYDVKSKHDLYKNTSMDNPYLISNDLAANEVSPKKGYSQQYQHNEELLGKLNYIINMFEEQKEIKTKQKNEEVVLYCFLGIFTIYVLDSFVYIGKYSR